MFSEMASGLWLTLLCEWEPESIESDISLEYKWQEQRAQETYGSDLTWIQNNMYTTVYLSM